MNPLINHWTNWPLRQVRSVNFLTTRYNRIGEGTNQFILACGHTAYAKLSQGEPKRKRCRDCYLEGWKEVKLLR